MKNIFDSFENKQYVKENFSFTIKFSRKIAGIEEFLIFVVEGGFEICRFVEEFVRNFFGPVYKISIHTMICY